MAMMIGKTGSIISLDGLPYAGAGTSSPLKTFAEFNDVTEIFVDIGWTYANGEFIAPEPVEGE